MIETIHLQLLLATFAGWVGRQQTAVITYLIEENRVLREQLESGGRRSSEPSPSTRFAIVTSAVTRESETRSSAGRNLKAMALSRPENDLAGSSSTTIGGQPEMGDINAIFGHYGVRP